MQSGLPRQQGPGTRELPRRRLP